MFNLFRNEKSGDFNEKELYVLNLLKNHIANMLHNVMRLDRASITVNKSLNNFAKTYDLTSRESEILSTKAYQIKKFRIKLSYPFQR